MPLCMRICLSDYGLVLLQEILYGEEGADMELFLRPASQPFYELYVCLAMRVAAVLQASKTVPARRAVAQSLDRAMNRSPQSDVGGGLRCENHRR